MPWRKKNYINFEIMITHLIGSECKKFFGFIWIFVLTSMPKTLQWMISNALFHTTLMKIIHSKNHTSCNENDWNEVFITKEKKKTRKCPIAKFSLWWETQWLIKWSCEIWIVYAESVFFVGLSLNWNHINFKCIMNSDVDVLVQLLFFLVSVGFSCVAKILCVCGFYFIGEGDLDSIQADNSLVKTFYAKLISKRTNQIIDGMGCACAHVFIRL